MKRGLIAGGLLLLGCFVTSVGHAADPATQPTTRRSPAEDRLNFLTLQLSSDEESIKAINAAMRAAGFKAVVAAEKAQAAEHGNVELDRKGGGPVPWDQFYGRTARAFLAPVPRGTRGRFPYFKRPTQFDYLYKANREQAATARQQVAAMDKRLDVLLARRRALESDQVSIWGAIALETIAVREIQFQPLYRFALQRAPSTATTRPANAGQLQIVRSLVLYLRTVDRAAAQTVAALPDHPEAATADLRKDVDQAAAQLQESLLTATAGADLPPAGAAELKGVTSVAKNVQALCKNISDAHRLALEGDAAGDEPRKQTFRGQLQDALIAVAETTAELDESIQKLAADWSIRGEPGVPSPDTLPAPVVVTATTGTPPHAPTATATAPPASGAHGRLFDGKTLDGWTGDAHAWTVVDGAIRGRWTDKSASFLYANGTYADFHLELQVKLVSGNSGIVFRADPAPGFGLKTGYEADIYLPNAMGKLALNNEVLVRPAAALQKKVYKAGQWNAYTIEAKGDHIQIWINGTLMSDAVSHGPQNGRIGLQVDGKTEVYFRDIQLRELH